jgi:hypothetical protein
MSTRIVSVSSRYFVSAADFARFKSLVANKLQGYLAEPNPVCLSVSCPIFGENRPKRELAWAAYNLLQFTQKRSLNEICSPSVRFAIFNLVKDFVAC